MSREREKWGKKKSNQTGRTRRGGSLTQHPRREKKWGEKKNSAQHSRCETHTCPGILAPEAAAAAPEKKRKKKKTGKQKHRAGQGTRSEETAMLEKRNKKK